MQETSIEWTDFTVNFWEGRQKVGPGCDNCYAEARDMRFTGGEHWGPGAPRRFVKGGIAKLRMINRTAKEFRELNGHWPRVFCSSLSDVFDNQVDVSWREDAFAEIGKATNTRPQLLTKRVGNVEKMIPDTWRDGAWPSHVGLMITVVNQQEANRDIPKLLDLKARLGIPWVGLSIEPMLGPVDLTSVCTGWHFIHCLEGFKWHDTDRAPNSQKCESVDWVVCGGESGRNARPMHPEWVWSLRDQCFAAETPFLFKQWGEWLPYGDQSADGVIYTADKGEKPGLWHEWPAPGAGFSVRLGKKRAGRLLHGRTWDQFPDALVG